MRMNKMNITESLTNLNISEECFQDIISLIEGELINFQTKRLNKILDKNARKTKDLFDSGAFRAVRFLPNGEPMGDPYVVKTLKNISKENQDAMNAAWDAKFGKNSIK